MQVVLYDRFGEPHEVVRCVERPAPKPGPGQAVVALEAAAIHPSDILTLRGAYAARPRFPGAIPGNEGVGRVVSVGRGVTLPLGTRVLLPMGCGTWRDRHVVSATSLIELPDEADPLQLAMAMVNPPTAWLLLHEMVSLRPGEWVVQNAGNSAVGQLVARFARELGLRTLSVVRRESAGRTVRAAGGDAVMVDEHDLQREAQAYTGGAQVRLALDAVGGDATDRIARCLTVGGTVVNYGSLSGQPCQLSSDQTIFRGVGLQGFWLATWLQNASMERKREVLDPLVARVAQGELHVPVEATYSLDRVDQALEHADRPNRSGKVLLVGEAYEGKVHRPSRRRNRQEASEATAV